MNLSKYQTAFWSELFRWRSVIWLAIVWGCLIRFYNLEAKVYWEDETMTSLRVSGHSRQELMDAAFQGQVIYPEDLLRFQVASESRGLWPTVASLADDVHPPGYFALLRLWADRFGSAVSTMRAFSAVLSLCLLPCVYALAMTLFESRSDRHQVAMLAVALVAISPYHLVLAAEARMYSLWPAAAALTGTCLLRAVRRNRPSDWLCYAIAGVGLLYLHWFSVGLLVGFSLYVCIVRGFAWRRAQKFHLLSLLCMGAAILPWIVFVGRRLNKVYYQTRWTAAPLDLVGPNSLVALWLKHALLLFFNGDVLAPWLQAIGGAIVVVAIARATLFLVQHTARPVWAFLLIFGAIIFGPLAVSDLAFGGQRSTIFRYMSASAIALEITVAFFLIGCGNRAAAAANAERARANQVRSQRPRLMASVELPMSALPAKATTEQRATQIADVSGPQDIVPQDIVPQDIVPQDMGSFWGQIAKPRAVVRLATVALLLVGALSQTVALVTFSAAQHPLMQVATVLNGVPQARLVSAPSRPGLLLPLAHLLDADTQLQLTVQPQIPDLLPAENRTVFLYRPSPQLRAAASARGYSLQPVSGVDALLKLEARD